MLDQIRGIHHITSLAGDAARNNHFFTGTLGLRRVKKTVNFDAPDVYHLYYADRVGTPGTVMTYFPFPGAARGRPGSGEVSTTAFAVPGDALDYWEKRLSGEGIAGVERHEAFGERRLAFSGPDGERFALVEVNGDERAPWTEAGIPIDFAIRGFHSASLKVRDAAPMEELMALMGYDRSEHEGETRRLVVPRGNNAHFIDIEASTEAPARQGAGSVHHIAFAVKDRAAQLAVRQGLAEAGHQVTPVIDRDYFFAVYFRTPGGVLFEIATDEPGFDRDEDVDHLGEALKLPEQHAHLRGYLEAKLPPLEA